MCYTLRECNSEVCAAWSEIAYGWHGTMLSCLLREEEEVFFYAVGEHIWVTSSSKKKLTLAQKAFCRDLAEHHLRPMQTRHAIFRTFDTQLDDLQALNIVRKFVDHSSRAYVSNNDHAHDVRYYIHAGAFTDAETTIHPFTFAWDLHCVEKPVVKWLRACPSIVQTSKAFIRRLLLPPDGFVLHMDASYKMKYSEYPILVVSVMDRSCGYHVVALFIIFKETQYVVQPTLMTLRRLFVWVTGRDVNIQFAMPDVDQAQPNDLNAELGDFSGFTTLMFFHVIEYIFSRIDIFIT
ncbi:hypothetical protein PHMEG_0007554 [Phytophthora megakarya]|uniref:MULE transposase domain-containing protein n=1 Tax=Phytophthora megakarya TaxID=4795 RepID=A0A225WMJ5_9STRA|nr:hypothetical protein PHMEG_0007554 [Phytophthora megakarya]